ncbi:ATP-binding cassette domain-containing protein [Kineococcus rubinsiae]|uniref:ATP-binding cassette domain-containing protein n=1 Tax=Kineococcus rubinsiae TaxID=2609562 RepID=UPI001430C920|nr:excinuclease ABC subunit UvrA [Kineococcus rubinsiae]NIZ90726.1 excinuclease ABC subunit UvrA [Kineococcus rubinsiae]
MGSRHIEVRGARENNLKDVSLDIPKGAITVFTGVSGSGKSSLVFGTIAAESQRLLNETHTAFVQNFLPSIPQPDADALRNLSAAIVVGQERMGGNSRSTVGTVTDLQTMLRLVFARLGEPAVAHASQLSFTSPEGMCPRCEGQGRVDDIDVDELVDWDLSLNAGAIKLADYQPGKWYHQIFTESGFFDNDKPLREFTPAERETFLRGATAKVKTATMTLTYEGLLDKFRRTHLAKDYASLQPHVQRVVDRVVTSQPCPDCGGSRFSATVLRCRVAGRNIAECTAMQVTDLLAFLDGLDAPALAPLLTALRARLGDLVFIGLGYLSLDRSSPSLSGGEAQRVKMVRHLGSALTDLTYVFDEPSVGLHPHDLGPLTTMLRRLRDKGNTVLVVEHKPLLMSIADHVVDMGPGAGAAGGEVVFEGTFAGLRAADTRTGRRLAQRPALRERVRERTGSIAVRGASLHNLRAVDVDVPTGVLTAVTGIAGSGKSSLVLGALAAACPGALVVDQSLARGSRRSMTATYTGMMDEIRKAFAKANGVPASLFSANSAGACPTCNGLGSIYTDVGFLEQIVTVCESCEGSRYQDEVLTHTLRGRNIAEVLGLSAAQAAEHFTEKPVRRTLDAMVDVGLGYLGLGQTLSTLSGGERQRLKLAMELGTPGGVYLLDEPTTGLHLGDVEVLVGLLDRLVDGGSTVVVVEHHLDLVSQADWVVDLGPGAGTDGGDVVFEGTPRELAAAATTTGTCLREHLAG